MSDAARTTIDRDRLATLFAAERARFAEQHPASCALHEQAGGALLSGVPMNWMTRWPGDFPLFARSAQGSHVTDVDGRDYADFCLGDTGAMTGHAPAPTLAAIAEQSARGLTLMLPTEQAAPAGEELARRFGLPLWQFTLSASDANRFVLRLARQLTGRPKVLVFNHCYHGSVDETVARLGDDGVTVEPRHGNIGPAVDPAQTTRVVEFNDLAALERELAAGDVAAVLAEPALTNIGIVLPEPGYHDELRRLTRAHGTLLVIDETHTLCCGPGGATAAWGLEPDVVTIGKPIAGGIATGAYGLTAAVAERVLEGTIWEAADVGGVGGTLAGNPLQLAAVRATLEQVLTDDAYAHMIAIAERFTAGVQETIGGAGLDWHVTRLGCRVEYMFGARPARSGGEAAAAFDVELDAYLHLHMLNRDVLMTPFHMMALMCPATSAADVDRHTAAFGEAVAALTA
jgi:glutamate-1-semialdehyde aminotransferase